jgi:hypothetical protein
MECWPDDAVYTNPSNRIEWVPNSSVGENQGRNGAAPPVLVDTDLPNEDWQQPHEEKRERTTSTQHSPALNETKAGEPKSGCEFNQAFVDAITTMQDSRTKLYPRKPQKHHPGTPGVSKAEPPRKFHKTENVSQQPPKHNDSFESIESWETDN